MMKSNEQHPTICSLFEEQVARHPENIAVYLDENYITYSELNKKVNQYARFLQKQGLCENGIVGIQLKRSYEMIVAIFAVFKAGGAYLPLDPHAPELRNRTILKDGQIKFLIVDNHSLIPTVSQLYDKPDLQILSIRENVSHEADDNLLYSIGKEDLAYVMYTSGTTGKPKGVMITLQALINRIIWMQDIFPLQSKDVLFHKTYPCFDISVWEICWWAVTGASVVILPPKKEHDIKLFIQMIEKYQITVIQMVPSVLRIFLSYIKENFSMQRLSSLKYVFGGGEVLDAHSVNLFNQLFYDQKTLLINLYGPTEATIDSSYFICEKQKSYRTIPIGKPIKNAQFFVLDDKLNQTGSGPGELFISGMGLAKGYLNNPELTKTSFIDNPYLPGEKMYRTGDIVYWNQEQELVFLNRKDDQVKLHGLRIELGEIQFQLLEHPDIANAAVISEKIDGLDQRLIAFLIAKNKQIKLSNNQLKSFLKARILDYMVPDHYVWLNELPIKENGKIDKAKLLSLL